MSFLNIPQIKSPSNFTKFINLKSSKKHNITFVLGLTNQENTKQIYQSKSKKNSSESRKEYNFEIQMYLSREELYSVKNLWHWMSFVEVKLASHTWHSISVEWNP